MNPILGKIQAENPGVILEGTQEEIPEKISREVLVRESRKESQEKLGEETREVFMKKSRNDSWRK